MEWKKLLQLKVLYIIQCEAPKIAKLVNITPITNYVTGAYKPTYNWEAPHCYIYIYITEMMF